MVSNVQVNLFQKHSFLHQLTHNMTTDCFLFWHSKQFVYTTCSQHVLSVEFSCTEHNSMNNLWSYCGLVDTRISASEKDLLPVFIHLGMFFKAKNQRDSTDFQCYQNCTIYYVDQILPNFAPPPTCYCPHSY